MQEQSLDKTLVVFCRENNSDKIYQFLSQDFRSKINNRESRFIQMAPYLPLLVDVEAKESVKGILRFIEDFLDDSFLGRAYFIRTIIEHDIVQGQTDWINLAYDTIDINTILEKYDLSNFCRHFYDPDEKVIAPLLRLFELDTPYIPQMIQGLIPKQEASLELLTEMVKYTNKNNLDGENDITDTQLSVFFNDLTYAALNIPEEHSFLLPRILKTLFKTVPLYDYLSICPESQRSLVLDMLLDTF